MVIIKSSAIKIGRSRQYSNQISNAPLEQLPSEVRRDIIFGLEYEELSALVHASPVFHQQYLIDRRVLLCTCLESSLHSSSITFDVCAVYRTDLLDFSDTRSRDKTMHFLHSYQDQRFSADYSIFNEGLAEGEVVEIAAFHFTVIRPLVRQYTDWALTNLADQTKGIQSIIPLSKMEEIRLLRAFYRFQLCCNFFGINPDSSRRFRPGFDYFKILTIFLAFFEPWEVEEMICVYIFSREMYTQIFKEIHWDVDASSPKFEGEGPPTPLGAFHLDDASLLTGTISVGLRVLHSVLIARDDGQRVIAMQEHISWPVGDFLECYMGPGWLQSLSVLSEQELMELRCDALPFGGDGEPCPTLGWTTLCQGIYRTRYGLYLTDEAIHPWGYVIWDMKRLEDTGGKDLLVQLAEVEGS